jgi:hypothetical protein
MEAADRSRNRNQTRLQRLPIEARSEELITPSGDTKIDGAHWRQSFTPARFVLLLVAFIFALYPEVIIGTHSFFDRDFGLFTYPVAHYARERLWHAEVPLWNPLSNCGVPFFAQWNTSLCYPLSWSYLLLPLPWSLNYFCLGHLVIAGLGMYLLALAWTRDRFAASIAGLSYGLNGFIFNCLMWTSNLAALALLPWTVWLVERAFTKGGRAVLVAALAGALQMLSGAPEIIAITWVIVGALWLGKMRLRQIDARKSFARLCLWAVLVLSLSAVQLIPFAELAFNSSRKASAESAAWSMPAWGLANFFVPLFHCIRTRLGPFIQVNQQWTSSYYAGIGTMTLAMVGIWKVHRRIVWWLGALLLVGLFLALGENSAAYLALAKAMPALSFIRYPIKFLTLAVFALPLLAAFAVAAFQDRPDLHRSGLGIVATVTLVAVAVIAFIGWRFPFPEEIGWHTALNGAVRAIFVVLIYFAFAGQNRSGPNMRKIAFGWALLCLFGLDAITHTARQNPTVPNIAYGPITLEMSARPALGASRAMVSPRMQAVLGRSSTTNALVNEVGNRKSLFEDSNLIDGVPKVNGFFSLYLREQQAIDTLLYNPTNVPQGLINFLGVTEESSPTEYWEWDKRPGALPLLACGQNPRFATDDQAIKAIANPSFDSVGTVYLPQEAQALFSDIKASRASVTLQNIEPEQIDANVTSSEPAVCTIAQTFSRSWKAFVDGRAVPIIRANYGFQAIKVPAGIHHVRFIYHDAGFYGGMICSIVSLLVIAALWFWQSVAPRRLGTAVNK